VKQHSHVIHWPSLLSTLQYASTAAVSITTRLRWNSCA
jgi:hypothetical protein